MEEITLQVQHDEQSGRNVAWWDDPDGAGGITTQGQDLRDLQQQITEAVSVHFDEDDRPRRIRIHFVSDPILVLSVKLPRDVSGAEAPKALERLGFSVVRQTGSHVRMGAEIAHHGADAPPTGGRALA
jgi:HicA toxin of bacterial toxin-antitoxin,